MKINSFWFYYYYHLDLELSERLRLSCKLVHQSPLSSIGWISLITCLWTKNFANVSSLVDEYKVQLNDKLSKRAELIWGWLQISRVFLSLQLFQQANDAVQKALNEIARREKELGASFSKYPKRKNFFWFLLINNFFLFF